MGEPADRPDMAHAHYRYEKAQQECQDYGNSRKFKGRFDTCQQPFGIFS
jgi:hypothetical protein